MKRKLSAFIVTLLLFAAAPLQAHAQQLLIPVGEVIGLQLLDRTVTVAAYDDTLGQCARDAGLKIGDEILKIGDREIHSAEDVRGILDGEAATVTVRRSGKVSTVTLTPEKTEEGYRMGVYLRQGIAGIGTVTFYDPTTGAFGALGHGVSSPKGKLLNMTRGYAYEASLNDVKKGCPGDPGQLRGTVEGIDAFASLRRNTPQGVFGVTKPGWKGEGLPVAAYEEIHTGEATIRCTVTGGSPQEYSVEILKIYPETREDGRNFLLRVTDPGLLELTGGVVQGMSGSPIIQDGRLVGAVTHVLVNDPTTGYGIYIQKMLDAAA